MLVSLGNCCCQFSIDFLRRRRTLVYPTSNGVLPSIPHLAGASLYTSYSYTRVSSFCHEFDAGSPPATAPPCMRLDWAHQLVVRVLAAACTTTMHQMQMVHAAWCRSAVCALEMAPMHAADVIAAGATVKKYIRIEKNLSFSLNY